MPRSSDKPKSRWAKNDPALLDRLRRALGAHEGIDERAMFGGRCFLLNGNMLCGVGDARYMFRVGKAREAEALARAGASPIVLGGRRMGGLVWVEPGACGPAALGRWIALAVDYVGTLPAK